MRVWWAVVLVLLGGSPVSAQTEQSRPGLATNEPVTVQPLAADGCLGADGLPVPSVLPLPTPSTDPDRIRTQLGGSIPLAPGDTLSSVASSQIAPGVQLELLLPARTLLAGEAVDAVMRVTNQSADAVMVLPPRPVWHGWTATYGFRPGSWRGSSPGPIQESVDPGAALTWSHAVQLPFEHELPPDRTVTLQALIQSQGDAAPGSNQAAWPTYATPEVPIELAQAEPRQQLNVLWQSDGQRVCAHVTDGLGAPPTGPLVAWVLARGRGLTIRRLGGGPDVFAGEWTPLNGAPLQAQSWVAGPNYVTALTDFDVP